MAKSPRQEFTERVKRTVGERAAYICTNPACRRGTIFPHSDPQKSLKTGEACHICAAAEGGPGYDTEQTDDERHGIQNAVWLCTECHTRFDNDRAEFTEALIHEWKRAHEDWIRNGGVVPALPRFAIKTLSGRTLLDTPSIITAQDCSDAREHIFTIANDSETQLLMIDARVQLLEPIIACIARNLHTGIRLDFPPNRMAMQGFATGGATVARTRPPLPAKSHQLQIDRHPARHSIELVVSTAINSDDRPSGNRQLGTLGADENSPHLRTFIDGTFQFEYRGGVITRRFFVPLKYTESTRELSVIEIREDIGKWAPVDIAEFS